jgi:hypothetical protein
MAKPCVEGCSSIDFREWHRRGLLEFGAHIGWHFQREGKEILFVLIEVDLELVVLVFKHEAPDKKLKEIELPIWLSWSLCHYGGERVWFRCPGLPCGRSQVAILYKAKGGFSLPQVLWTGLHEPANKSVESSFASLETASAKATNIQKVR